MKNTKNSLSFYFYFRGLVSHFEATCTDLCSPQPQPFIF